MNADGSGLTRLTEGQQDTGPVWSPNGDKIAFTRTTEEFEKEVWTVNADGTGQSKIAVGEYDLDWSPDGDEFAMYGVAVMGADGSDPRGLVGGWAPAWSPDGSKIAFTSIDDDEQGIFVMSDEGADVTRLTGPVQGESGGTTIVVETDDDHPAWSPDGEKIAFVRSTPDGQQIWVMNADGSGQAQLADNGSYPAWHE